MLGRLSILTPPSALPISLDLVKQHLRIDNPGDDALLPLYIASAVTTAESYLNRSLCSTQYRWSLSESAPLNPWPLVPTPLLVIPLAIEYSFTHWPHRPLELPRSPVQSVDAMTYANWGDVSDTELDSSHYDLDLACDPARVMVHSDVPWGNRRHLSIDYTAGYTVTPQPIVHALLLMLGWAYEHRGDQDAGDIPQAALALLRNYRIMTFF